MPRKKIVPVDESEMKNETSLPEGSAGETSVRRKENSAQSFYDVDYNEMDKDLSPDQKKEWTAIYASFRSRTPLCGTVIGFDTHELTVTSANAELKRLRLFFILQGSSKKHIIFCIM